MLYCIPLFTALSLLYPPAYLTRIAALRPMFDRINHTSVSYTHLTLPTKA